MQRAKDYIFLSVLAYCNFEKDDYGKSIKKIYEENNLNKLTIDYFKFCTEKNYNLFFEFFKDILDKWEVFYIENKRAGFKKNSTGFYGIVFKHIREDRYVISYRGSEKFPVEDAYKDFIENDLKIGLGEKPVQFYDGIELYNKMYKEYKISKEKLSVTGHSLGGGIAQFVGLMIDKEHGFIPEIYTWNAVGIKRDGIINIVDFIDYNKILDNFKLNDIEKKYFLDFKDEYLSFLLKELKKNKIIKDNSTVLILKNIQGAFRIDETFIKNFVKNTNFNNLLDKLSNETKDNLLKGNRIFYKFFEIENLINQLLDAEVFLKIIENNKRYEEKIKNICHSEDMTSYLFAHVGSVYLIDKKLIKKTYEKNTIFFKFLIFTKAVEKYHYQDVFFPFLENKGEGVLGKNLSNEHISSIIRKIFLLEYSVEKELLADYYSLITITDKNFNQIRDKILNAIIKNGDDILYKKHAYEQLKKMDINSFSKMWENLKLKLPSPYRQQDIFDIMLFQ